MRRHGLVIWHAVKPLRVTGGSVHCFVLGVEVLESLRLCFELSERLLLTGAMPTKVESIAQLT